MFIKPQPFDKRVNGSYFVFYVTAITMDLRTVYVYGIVLTIIRGIKGMYTYSFIWCVPNVTCL